MDPVSLVVICAVSFGGLVTIASVIHQYYLSRNQKLNQLAEERVLLYQQKALEKIRKELKKDKFKAHHALLNENKEAISHIDKEINDLMEDKAKLVNRFAELIATEIKQNRKTFFTNVHKKKIEALKEELSIILSQFDERLNYFQTQRADLLDSKKEIEQTLREKENMQNKALNALYKQHGEFVEKIHLVQSEHRLTLAHSIVDATTSIFDKLIMAPAKFISAYFSKSSNLDTCKTTNEIKMRARILALESKLKIGIESENFNAEISL